MEERGDECVVALALNRLLLESDTVAQSEEKCAHQINGPSVVQALNLIGPEVLSILSAGVGGLRIIAVLVSSHWQK